jgi:hypothetical protein
MNKTIQKGLTILLLLVALYAIAAMVATVTQLADGADRLYQGAGQPVFWALLILFSGLVTYPLVLLLKMPKPLRPPTDKEEPYYSQYRDWLREHLNQNPREAVRTLAVRNDLEGALSVLDKDADRIIRSTASSVFVSTALMQNGRLDGLIMLTMQLRLVWQVATIYNLRPSPRQLWYLYSNVGATMLLASSLDDVNYAELASPIVSAVAPSIASAVPGLQGIGNLLVNSLASGSANAFLTLRIGLIAKAYCAPLVEPERKLIRQSATTGALKMLGIVSREKFAQVAKAVWDGVKPWGNKKGKATESQTPESDAELSPAETAKQRLLVLQSAPAPTAQK